MYTLQELQDAMLPRYVPGINAIHASHEVRYAIVSQLRSQGKNARMHPDGVYIHILCHAK